MKEMEKIVLKLERLPPLPLVDHDRPRYVGYVDVETGNEEEPRLGIATTAKSTYEEAVASLCQHLCSYMVISKRDEEIAKLKKRLEQYEELGNRPRA